jgi:hypothetical protein
MLTGKIALDASEQGSYTGLHVQGFVANALFAAGAQSATANQCYLKKFEQQAVKAQAMPLPLFPQNFCIVCTDQ